MMLNFIQSGPRSVVVLLALTLGGGTFDVIFLTTEFLTALLLAFVGVFKNKDRSLEPSPDSNLK